MSNINPDNVAASLLAKLRDIRKRYAKQLTKADRDEIDHLSADVEAVIRKGPIDVAQVTHLRASGKTWQEIEEITGFTRRRIDRAMRAAGQG